MPSDYNIELKAFKLLIIIDFQHVSLRVPFSITKDSMSSYNLNDHW